MQSSEDASSYSTFQNLLARAFLRLLWDEPHSALTKAFLDAYLTRRDLSWLPESREGGIAGAFRRALALYPFSEGNAAPAPTAHGADGPHVRSGSQTREGHDYRAEIDLAIREVCLDAVAVSTFSHALSDRGFRLETITESGLAEQLASALAIYVERAVASTNIEPW